VIPVLEIGGTHVSAALVDPADWQVTSSTRLTLDADASLDALLARFAAAAAAVRAPARSGWGVAIPDPFDYERGIGQFEGVGKFAALRGVDVGAALRSRLDASRLAFVNDADAFVLGEWVAGAAAGVHRCAGLTLGTGIGTGWLVGGEIVDPGWPPGGRLHRVTLGGRPLEDTVSRRAIRRGYAVAGGGTDVDVRQICELARAGEPRARRVLDEAFVPLGRVMGECLSGFRADVLVVGGSMAASWDVLAPAFRAGAQGAGLPEIRLAARGDDAGLLGAALHARRTG
jgi:glucokinase